MAIFSGAEISYTVNLVAFVVRRCLIYFFEFVWMAFEGTDAG